MDTFAGRDSGVDAPVGSGAAVAPNDDTDLTIVTRAVYVGGSGNLAVIMQSGAELTFENVSDGQLLPIRVSRIKSTGTTATSIVGLW
ncbi:hypothetical protein [Devosia sp. Naph2]|uniref:spike base protein, RCAP_Rcc01079 family n=1 Tax=Devosia polycyclovorans TaxID=3345148 RepID=UPI0035CEF33F